MRVVTTTVYEFGELSEQARQRAVEVIREKLNGPWWGSADDADVAAAMIYGLAVALGTPGHAEHSREDFPGISWIKLDKWRVGVPQAVAITGALDPRNAPNLPWVKGIDHVQLWGLAPAATGMDVIRRAEEACTCDPREEGHVTDCPYLIEATDEDIEALEQAVRDALREARKAGAEEATRKTSEQQARTVAPLYEFTADGEVYGRREA